MRLSYVIICDHMVLCQRASVQRIFRRMRSEIRQELEKSISLRVLLLCGYLRLLNQPKIASCAAKKTPDGRSGEEVFDEV